MVDEVQQQDDQNLWRAVYTAEHGWSQDTAFADHLSVAAPALVEANGALYCAHRGAREGTHKQLPLKWTSFTPSALLPLIAALEQAGAPLPEGASDEDKRKQQESVAAAAEALDRARRWTPDADADAIASAETPALVNDNGTVRMVFTRIESTSDGGSSSDGQRIRSTSLWETQLDMVDGSPTWAEPRQIPVTAYLPLAPGLAVFNGAVHLVFVDPQTRYLQHWVRGVDGGWTSAVDPDGSVATADREAALEALRTSGDVTALESILGKLLPHRGAVMDLLNQRAFDQHGWPGNVALAVHDGKLHALARQSLRFDFGTGPLDAAKQGGELVHAVFDGTAWSEDNGFPDVFDEEGGELWMSRRGAALASFDGKLHAVYPAVSSDHLIHTTWTGESDWTSPVKLEGHDSNNTPALLPFTEGPAGDERRALLLVHRGVDRYVPPTPPAPPAPPTLADVASRGETVSGKLLRAYGSQDWSRLEHRFLLTPVTLNNGEQALVVHFEAWAQYYFFWAWYRENYGGMYTPHLAVDFYLKEGGDRGTVVGHAQFSESSKTGYWRFQKVFTGVKPGAEYEARLFTANTEKTRGYWWNEKSPLESSDAKRNQEQYARVSNFRSSTASIILPS
ncbi:hypothetical protein [Kitasatospora sp. NPDC004289]